MHSDCICYIVKLCSNSLHSHFIQIPVTSQIMMYTIKSNSNYFHEFLMETITTVNQIQLPKMKRKYGYGSLAHLTQHTHITDGQNEHLINWHYPPNPAHPMCVIASLFSEFVVHIAILSPFARMLMTAPHTSSLWSSKASPTRHKSCEHITFSKNYLWLPIIGQHSLQIWLIIILSNNNNLFNILTSFWVPASPPPPKNPKIIIIII